MAIVFELAKKEYGRFIVEEDKIWAVFNFFNIKLNVKQAMLKKSVLYFVVSEGITDEGQVRGTVSYYNELPFHFNISERRSLIENNLEGENAMLDGFKIAEVTLGDINDVALEVAVEGMAKSLDGVTIKKKGTKTYLVKDGSTIELNGEEFQSMVANYIKGKTVSELRSNNSMYQLITKLGLVQKITLEKETGDLSAIFG